MHGGLEPAALLVHVEQLRVLQRTRASLVDHDTGELA
jgi:hypothetical protein